MIMNRTHQLSLTQKQVMYLREVGLSKEAIRLYELLIQKGKLTAQEAANFTGDHPSAEYRLFYFLEDRELVRRISGRPRSFEALPLKDGLQASFVDQQHELGSLLKLAINRIPTLEQATVVVGRQALYDMYVTLAPHAKHEICIYSIGIAYSNDLAQVQGDVIKRGVRVRHVVQQQKASNYYVIKKWLRLGAKVRYLAMPRGYHLTIIDTTHALVTFSDPFDTESRVTLISSNQSVVDIFIAQFNELWAESAAIAT